MKTMAMNRFRLAAALALLLSAGPVFSQGYRGIWYTLGQVETEYGDKYSGGLGTYTVKHIPMAIYAPQVNKTFFVYGGTTDETRKYLLCMAGCFDHSTGMLRRPVVVHDKGAYGVIDPHDNPTIQIDRDGYIWVFVAGRGNTRPGIRYRSSKPYDISSFEYVNESIMAYPQVFYDKDKGFFLFFTRYDGKRRTFFQTSPDGVNWSERQPIASIMEPGETLSGHYQLTNYDGRKLVCCFNRHIDGSCDTRTNIYYIQSEDWGKTWTNAAGEKVELPVTREENPALVRNFHREGRNCYIKDINFDKDGRPVILYLTSDNHITGPRGGERNWETVSWNGKDWEYSFITRSTHCYDSGSIYIDGDTWSVIAPTGPGPQYWGTGGEMALWCTENRGVIWEKFKDLTRNSRFNHAYARRPVNAHDGFYSFWADGDPDSLSISHLYFCNKAGDVFRMPYTMEEEWQKPETVSFPSEFDHSAITRSPHPRLLMDRKGMKDFRKKLSGKGLPYSSLRQLDGIIRDTAASILKGNKPVAMNQILSLAYCCSVHGDRKMLPRLKADLVSFCRSDWGKGFLSISENAVAVSLAYDWLWDKLTREERSIIRQALVDKVILASDRNHFRGFKGNWSSICNCGVIMACLAIYEDEPELAGRYLETSYRNNKENISIVYKDGGYPEGISYWNYGTQYQICLNEALRGVFGHDGGLSDTPGFMESAWFALYAHATGGGTFSFADGGAKYDHPMAASWWFASHLANPTLAFAEKRFLDRGDYASRYPRLLPALIGLFRESDLDTPGFAPPSDEVWTCQGEMPLYIVRRGWNYDNTDTYLGIKGGNCNTWKTMVTSHGHMDAGSFVFEAEGLRWSDDVMRPSYDSWFRALREAGSHSGATGQGGLRWNTFEVSNLCHSCLIAGCNDGSVRGKLHPGDYDVDGYATLTPLDGKDRQGAVIDMTAPMKGQVKSAVRTIVLLPDGTLEVTDSIEALPGLDCPLEWRMLTKAKAKPSGKHLVLSRDGAKRVLTATSSDKSAVPEFAVLKTEVPDSWKDGFYYIQGLKGRSIASWHATVPAGKTVTFKTTLRKP
ncbi:MAG: BNR-4 repeat-containing protein [Bacteroidales bacterium]|nr:BNR-4 repeat-containing protein [Bacteroidales bacterium]